ncbi:histidyl-tRNA synthetase [Catalinimonas alkaloidigena]|uniref:histidine--tRNA ligase n=1 Tax=Catalinimonas alkaloidigena TaxID=1075417 RepID=UPI002405E2B5|nr:histidine--tRNA ligase [Catalinimonas alkaloidigena]MDF9795850.1 histidyl-tRNA synthetase [Catalinimonas alkaloidigena]
MSKQKPSIPKGTRDFGPAEMAKRNYILDHIREVYRRYGYQQLETPSMENLSVLTGKYGDEGDQLLFKILNSGDFLSKTEPTDYNNGSAGLLPKIAEKGLRYDLTVPFARYVVMNQSQLTFPFRRFQIQPVWRADRPQKGRYREFYQCDADVVGTDSLTSEAEIVLMIEEVFERLGIKDISIKVNNRKILAGLVEAVGAQGKESDLLIAIDKLDKIGQEKVIAELQEKSFGQEAIDKLMPIFNVEGSNQSRLDSIRTLLAGSETGLQGVSEIEEVIERVQMMGSEAASLEFDITLARGLSYYTGAIFEVKANHAVISSSISGGGRYDDLTGVFGLPNVSGVGISFGVDRIYDVMEGLGLFPEENLAATQVLFICFDEETEKHALALLSQVRKAGISAEIYPDRVKLKKQFAYADKKGIPYTIVVGVEEIQQKAYGLKNLKSGEQENLSIEEIIERLKQ